MVNRASIAALALALLPSCHPSSPRASIDRAMASCIPAGSAIIAGADLAGLRASPLYAGLPSPARALTAQFDSAGSLLAAWNGRDLLLIIGAFTQAPTGATLVAPGIAVSGAPESVRAAIAQHQTGASGAQDLLAQAGSLARGNQIWVIVRGNTTLPLSGNAANVNRLLRNMEFAAVTVRVDSAVDFALAASGQTADAARRFEETLRATFTATAAAEGRHSDLASLLHSIRVTRNDRQVTAGVSADLQTTAKIFGLLAP